MKRAMNRAGKIGLGMMAAWLLAGCGALDDVSFARQLMNGLIAGRYAVRSMIDWPNFRFFEQEVGKQYSQFQKSDERTDFERAFIESFSKSYQAQGAKRDAFFNWQLAKSDDPKKSVVVANCHDKDTIFAFVIAKDGMKKKVTLIKVMQVFDEQKAQEQIRSGELAKGLI